MFNLTHNEMKKKFILAATLVVAFCSCSNDTEMVSSASTFEEQGMTPVVLGMSNSGITVTENSKRGTGTVGGMAGEDVSWRNEDVRVLMTTAGVDNSDWSIAKTACFDENVAFAHLTCKPTFNALDNVWELNYFASTGNNKIYYPMNGDSDFFAFYSDDAVEDKYFGYTVTKDANNQSVITLNEASTFDVDNAEIKLPFTIDGTQDLLAGKATNTSNGSKQGFSATTARANVVPNITMKHLLTRFTFEIVPGHDNVDGLIVSEVGVKSLNKGNIIVAYNELTPREATDLIDWTLNAEGEEMATFMLKERVGDVVNSEGVKTKLTDFTEVELDIDPSLNLEENSKKIGEAMFVKPGETIYPMFITFKFPVHDAVGNIVGYNEKTESLNIEKSDKTAFEVGKSYNLQIKVYGYSDIRVIATLEPWENGGDVDLDFDPIALKNAENGSSADDLI